MSYSFSITAASKGEAAMKTAEALANVVTTQPVHVADQRQAGDAVNAYIGILKDPSEGEVINVSVSGSLSWRDADVFAGANLSINAYIANKA